MHFFSAVIAAATLIAGSNALFIPRSIHVADFRLYIAADCFDGNLGVWTVIDDDFKNGECNSLNDEEDGAVPHSLNLTDINAGCTCKTWPFLISYCLLTHDPYIVTAYTDLECTKGKTVLAPQQCSHDGAGFQAWSMACDYKN